MALSSETSWQTVSETMNLSLQFHQKEKRIRTRRAQMHLYFTPPRAPVTQQKALPALIWSASMSTQNLIRLQTHTNIQVRQMSNNTATQVPLCPAACTYQRHTQASRSTINISPPGPDPWEQTHRGGDGWPRRQSIITDHPPANPEYNITFKPYRLIRFTEGSWNHSRVVDSSCWDQWSAAATKAFKWKCKEAHTCN